MTLDAHGESNVLNGQMDIESKELMENTVDIPIKLVHPREIYYANYRDFEYTPLIGGHPVKRIVFFFLFCLITLVLAEWAAAKEIVGRIKDCRKKIPGYVIRSSDFMGVRCQENSR